MMYLEDRTDKKPLETKIQQQELPLNVQNQLGKSGRKKGRVKLKHLRLFIILLHY